MEGVALEDGANGTRPTSSQVGIDSVLSAITPKLGLDEGPNVSRDRPIRCTTNVHLEDNTMNHKQPRSQRTIYSPMPLVLSVGPTTIESHIVSYSIEPISRSAMEPTSRSAMELTS